MRESPRNKDELDQLTVDKILKSLKPSHLWAVLVAIAAVVGGSFELGQRLNSWITPATSPVPCAQAAGWPIGQWWTWGHIDSEPTSKDPFPQYSRFVIFDSNKSYLVITDEHDPSAIKNRLEMSLLAPLRAGDAFQAAGTDGTGYTSNVVGTVSSDGCRLEGAATDSNGNRGDIHFMYKRDEYYVLPK